VWSIERHGLILIIIENSGEKKHHLREQMVRHGDKEVKHRSRFEAEDRPNRQSV
jgi:hypothetical protein